MKFNVFFPNGVRSLLLLTVLVFQIAGVFSQSAQIKETPTESQIIQTNADKENKNDDFSKLEPFEYIEPSSIEKFEKKLNEFGAKKYRFRDLTQVPTGAAGKEETMRMTIQFAGIVKLDETQYEYKIIDVEKTLDLAAVLNREAKEGFNLRETINYSTAISFEREEDDTMGALLQTLRSLPRIHNLVLLERETDKVSAPREFQVLKAGFGIGKKPTEEMKTLLAEAVKENFYPVGIFAREGLGASRQSDDKLRFLDNYYGIIVEKTSEEPGIELEFVRAYTQANFNKRVNKLASQGFRINDAGFIYGLMLKERADAPPIPKNYHWINADSKNFAAQLLRLSNAGARLCGTAMNGSENVINDNLTFTVAENRLIFEQLSVDPAIKYEYEILPMIPDPTQVFLIGKTVVPGDEPLQKFKRVIKQGYLFTDLIYADKKVTAIFERPRAN